MLKRDEFNIELQWTSDPDNLHPQWRVEMTNSGQQIWAGQTTQRTLTLSYINSQTHLWISLLHFWRKSFLISKIHWWLHPFLFWNIHNFICSICRELITWLSFNYKTCSVECMGYTYVGDGFWRQKMSSIWQGARWWYLRWW